MASLHRKYESQEWDTSSKTVVPPKRKYHPGLKVGHDIWGEGLVLKSVVEDEDEIVDIFFESVGLKRVAASIARLDIKKSKD